MRTNNQAFVNQLLIYTLFTICLSGSIGLGTVWLRHQISLTANASRVLESRLAELDRRLAESTTAVETQQDPVLLKQRNLELRLGLVLPASDRVVSVTEDPGLYLASKHNLGLYGDSAAVSVRFNDGPAPAPMAARHREDSAAFQPVSFSVSVPNGVRFASKN